MRSFRRIDVALTAMGVDAERAMFDPAIVRGLEYYTGPVFEAEALLTDDKGKRISFGSIGGGGRYDDLVARFTGERTPATGFSFGVSRLAATLKAAGLDSASEQRGPVVVIAFSPDHMAEYFAISNQLRGAGVPAEVYLGASGMKAQMKYADRRRSPAVITARRRRTRRRDGDHQGSRRWACAVVRRRQQRRMERGPPRPADRAARRHGRNHPPHPRRRRMTTEPLPPPEVMDAVRAPFVAFGGVWVDAPVLQPLGALLDLAGEAMRARLIVVSDGVEDSALRPPISPFPWCMRISSPASPRDGSSMRARRSSPLPAARWSTARSVRSYSARAPTPPAMTRLSPPSPGPRPRLGGRGDLSLQLGDVGLFRAFLGALRLPEPAINPPRARLAEQPGRAARTRPRSLIRGARQRRRKAGVHPRGPAGKRGHDHAGGALASRRYPARRRALLPPKSCIDWRCGPRPNAIRRCLLPRST